MTQTLVTHTDLIRRAAAWIHETAAERGLQPGLGGRSGAGLEALLDEAGMRFNLSPSDAAALRAVFADTRAGS